MVTISTLASLKESRHYLWASCAADGTCTHFSDLDTDQLIERFGRDFEFVRRKQELLDVLRCERCGRKFAIRLAAPNGYTGRR